MRKGTMPRKFSKKYVPAGLTAKDKAAQIASLQHHTERPHVESFSSQKSGWTQRAHNHFGGNTSLRNIAKVTGASMVGMKAVLQKGRGAYYSSGSRPNQTAESWARARLYSVLFGGKARKIDKAIVQEYNIPCLKCTKAYRSG